MIFDILDYRLLKDIALHVCLSGVPKNLLIFWERRKNEALQATKWLPVAEFLPTTGPPKAQHEVLGRAEATCEKSGVPDTAMPWWGERRPESPVKLAERF